MIRIINPFEKHRNHTERPLKPILLHHGFQCTGSVWLIAANGKLDKYGNYIEYISDGDKGNYIINGTIETANTLAFVLATHGYDVWLANYRGSVYSTNHTQFPVNSEQFWSFSIDEMVKYDLPAEIDYILKQTNQSSIGFIGHSQGNLMMFGLLSLNNTYTEKIRPFISLSPVFYNIEMRSALSKLTWFKSLLQNYPTTVPFSKQTRLIISSLCENIYIRYICHGISYPILGTQIQNIFIVSIAVKLHFIFNIFVII